MTLFFNKNIKTLFLASLALKLLFASFLPLFHDETYYWVWGQNLQLSYFDHPPLIAWLSWLGQIIPFDFLFRWPAVILAHGAILLWLHSLKDYLNHRELEFWLILFLLMPLTGPGSIVFTPDLALMIALPLCFYTLTRFMKTPNFKNVFIFGLSLGLGFLAKYHIVIFPLATLFYVCFRNKLQLVHPKYLVTCILGFIMAALPVFLWNYANDFISFKFQLNHGLGGKSWDPMWSVNYLSSQLLLIFPTVAILAFKNLRKEFNIISAFAIFPLAFFLLTSFKGHVEANWPAMAYPFVLALAVKESAYRLMLKSTAVFWATIFLIVFSISTFSLYHLPKKTYESREFSEIIYAVEGLENVYTYSFQIASQISYQNKKPAYKLYGVGRKDFFDQHPSSKPNSKYYYYVNDKQHPLPSWTESAGHKIIAKQKINSIYDLYLVERP